MLILVESLITTVQTFFSYYCLIYLNAYDGLGPVQHISIFWIEELLLMSHLLIPEFMTIGLKLYGHLYVF